MQETGVPGSHTGVCVSDGLRGREKSRRVTHFSLGFVVFSRRRIVRRV